MMLKLKLQYFGHLMHWKRPWCWERLKARGEGDDRGWDGWMASLTQWTWVRVNFVSWWWTGGPGVLQLMGSQTVKHNWATEVKWTEEVHNLMVLFYLAHSCLTLGNPMDWSTPGLPVHHQLPGFTQTHVHWVSDAIQPSHPLSPPSPLALNFSSIRVFSNDSAL